MRSVAFVIYFLFHSLVNGQTLTAFQKGYINSPKVQKIGGKLLYVNGDRKFYITDLNSTSEIKGLDTLLKGVDFVSSISFKGKIYFMASDGNVFPFHGMEIWQTDGTYNGTKMVYDLCKGPCSTNIEKFVNIHDSLFALLSNKTVYWLDTENGNVLQSNKPAVELAIIFTSDSLNYSLYAKDTNGGKLYVKRSNQPKYHLLINPAYEIEKVVVGKTKLFYWCRHQFGGPYELYVVGAASSVPKLINKCLFLGEAVLMGDSLFCTVYDSTVGVEIFTYFPNSSFQVLKDIISGAPIDVPNPTKLTVSGRKLFFTANDGTNGNELWVSDGTEVGTQLVKDIYPGNVLSSSNPSDIFAIETGIVFIAFDGKETRMYISDGTISNTKSLNVEIMDKNFSLSIMKHWDHFSSTPLKSKNEVYHIKSIDAISSKKYLVSTSNTPYLYCLQLN